MSRGSSLRRSSARGSLPPLVSLELKEKVRTTGRHFTLHTAISFVQIIRTCHEPEDMLRLSQSKGMLIILQGPVLAPFDLQAIKLSAELGFFILQCEL